MKVDAVCCSLLANANTIVCLCVVHPAVFEARLLVTMLRRTVYDLRKHFQDSKLRFVMPQVVNEVVEFIEFDPELLIEPGDVVQRQRLEDQDLLKALETAFSSNPNAKAFLERLAPGGAL